MVEIKDFGKLELRVGTIVLAEDFTGNLPGVLDDYFFMYNISEPGIIHLGVCSNSGNMFSGSGMVAQIIFKSIGNLGEFSAVTFLDAQINSDWQVSTVDGSIEIILDKLILSGQDDLEIGADHSITLGMCNGCTDEWKFGEDEYDYPDDPTPFTNIHFYHPEWYGQQDENGNSCSHFEFSSDFRSIHQNF